MTAAPAPPRNSIGDLIKVAIVFACWIVGVIFRFLQFPLPLVGGGLLIVGTGLLAYWAKRRPR